MRSKINKILINFCQNKTWKALLTGLNNMGRHKNTFNFASQRGFSLLVALIFVSFFGAVLTNFVYNRSGESLREEAKITGWQAAKIARAARIHVRNELMLNPNLKFTLDINSAGPQIIDLNTLTGSGLLPADFGNIVGGVDVTALSQEIQIIMANYPVDGDPALDSTVPTAYVYLIDSNRSDAGIVQEIVQAIRREEVAIAAPVFDEAGNNLSGACNGLGDSVVIWDSGCMGEIEFTALTGDANFIPGSLVIPAWRSVNFDTRVLMRTPQPEVTGMNTMLTELEMGDPLADCATNAASRIQVPNDGAGETDLCGAISDDIAAVTTAEADRRRDIIGTRHLTGNSYIAYQQGGNDVTIDSAGLRTNAASDEVYSMDVAGSLTATGDMKAFDGDINVTGATTVDRNVIVPTRVGQTITANISGTLTSNSMTSTDLEVFNTITTAAPISANTTNATPAANIADSMVTSTMQMDNNGTVNVSQNADLLGDTNVSSTSIAGTSSAGSYSYVTGNLSVQNLNVGGDSNVSDTTVVAGASAIGTLNITNGGDAQCAGDCPERIAFCEQNGGALGFDCCMRNIWNDTRYTCVSDGGL